MHNKGSIEYVYDAAGAKLEKIVRETGKADKHTMYLFRIYEYDVLQFVPMEEGRIRPVRVRLLLSMVRMHLRYRYGF